MPPQPDTSLDLYHLKMLIILDKSNRNLFKRSSFRRVSYRANICTRIICNQWRHKITIIYGNRLAVYIHTWLICDVTKRQLCTRGYYYTTYSSLTNLEAVIGHCALQFISNWNTANDIRLESGMCPIYRWLSDVTDLNLNFSVP